MKYVIYDENNSRLKSAEVLVPGTLLISTRKNSRWGQVSIVISTSINDESYPRGDTCDKMMTVTVVKCCNTCVTFDEPYTGTLLDWSNHGPWVVLAPDE